MNSPPVSAAPIDETPGTELDALVHAITRLEAIVAGWDERYTLTVQALKTAIEELHREALARLIRALKADPAAHSRLRDALADPVVYGVLSFHRLIKAPLTLRVNQALDEVRPLLATHGGGVELVAVKPPDTVELRLTGSCHGCPASGQTLREGVEQAIRARCPEIVHVKQVSRAAPPAAAPGTAVHFISPFALHAASGWEDAGSVADIPADGVRECRVRGRSVLLARRGEQFSCVENSCAHLGMPLEMGDVQAGVITCPYHGFQYLLATGECLTAPEVQLKVHAVRLTGERVQVRLDE